MKIVVLIRNFRTIPPIIHLCRLPFSLVWQFNVCPAGDIALTVFVLPPPQPRFHPLSSPQYDSSRHKFPQYLSSQIHHIDRIYSILRQLQFHLLSGQLCGDILHRSPRYPSNQKRRIPPRYFSPWQLQFHLLSDRLCGCHNLFFNVSPA